MKAKVLAFALAPLLALSMGLKIGDGANRDVVEFDREVATNPVSVNTDHFNQTADHETNTIGAVFVHTYIESLAELSTYGNDPDNAPSHVILRIDKDINIVDSNGNAIGVNFTEAYQNYIAETMIPVIYIETSEVATALISYLNGTYCPLDMAVASNDSNLLKTVRSSTNGQYIRGILDLSGETDMSAAEIVAATNAAYANTVILNGDQATFENIYYIEGRTKSVWVDLPNYSDFDFLEAVVNGAYGVITSNVEDAYAAFDYFLDTDSPTRNMNRIPQNVAHRGLSALSYENSMEAYRLAYERGATHIETDVWITADQKLVVMHDASLDRTTNGSGELSALTSDEIKQYQINYINGQTVSEGVEIPFLEDLFAEFKGNGKLIVVEIKSTSSDMVPLLKELIDEYDIADQIVFISGYNEQLIRCRNQMPEIPTASLNTIASSTFHSTSGLATLNAYNIGIDFYIGSYTADYDRNLSERGFLGYWWTYSSTSSITQALLNGVVAPTNDYCNTMEEFATRLYYNETNTVEVSENFNINNRDYIVQFEQFNGELSETIALAMPLVSKQISEHQYEVILAAQYISESYTYNSVVFSDPITVRYPGWEDDVIEEETPDTETDEGTGGGTSTGGGTTSTDSGTTETLNLGLILGITIPAAILIIGGAITAAILLTKKPKKEE